VIERGLDGEEAVCGITDGRTIVTLPPRKHKAAYDGDTGTETAEGPYCPPRHHDRESHCATWKLDHHSPVQHARTAAATASAHLDAGHDASFHVAQDFIGDERGRAICPPSRRCSSRVAVISRLWSCAAGKGHDGRPSVRPAHSSSSPSSRSSITI